MLGRRRSSPPSLTLEEVRKKARLLVIDDHVFPYTRLFERDGYHIERWPKIVNMSQLTDGHFDLILLDLHGVALSDSPEMQGLGVLQHVKSRNPTQLIVAYSAQDWSASYRDFFALADAVFRKDDEYLTFKGQVDELLLRRYTKGFFVSKMNEALGDNAVFVPKAVELALRTMTTGSDQRIKSYLSERITDQLTIDRVLAIIGIAVAIFKK